ncbi:hydrolase [Colletotrichum tofieldiae]|nr:hydrolase [Colletotrichum tofieldiae]
MDNNCDPSPIPPIPHRYRNIQTPEPHPRRRSLPPPSRRSADAVPSSPEVISSLITSLSVISKPADQHFERSGPSLSLPVSPRHGSFGVDYGAFQQPSLENLPTNNVPSTRSLPPRLSSGPPNPLRLVALDRSQIPRPRRLWWPQVPPTELLAALFERLPRIAGRCPQHRQSFDRTRSSAHPGTQATELVRQLGQEAG